MITESSHQLCLAKVCIICIKQKINHCFFSLVLKFVQFLQISFKKQKNPGVQNGTPGPPYYI